MVCQATLKITLTLLVEFRPIYLHAFFTTAEIVLAFLCLLFRIFFNVFFK